MVTQMLRGTLSVLFVLGLASSVAVAHQDCATPLRTTKGNSKAVYRLKADQQVCLSHGATIQVRRIGRDQASLRFRHPTQVTSHRGSARLRSNHRSARFETPELRASVRLYRFTRENSVIIEVSIDLSSPDDSDTIDTPPSEGPPSKPTEPIACPMIEQVCTMEWRPVCGVTSQGSLRLYSNECHAMVACAQVVERNLCGDAPR